MKTPPLYPLVALVLLACGSSDASRRTRPQDASPDQAAGGSGGSSSTADSSTGGQNATGGSGGMIADDATADRSSTPDSSVLIDASADAGATDASADTGASDGAGGVYLEAGVLADIPYTCESPFAGIQFDSYFYLEDWEDGQLNTPGVTATAWQLSSTFGASLIDSVDCDDGVVDGVCVDCDALWASGSLELTFDASDAGGLGALPTHVGLVWTDGGGGANVEITGYDENGDVIYSESVPGIGDSSINGTVDEDRFFGIVAYGGIKRIRIVNSTGGLEIDHLQYGR